MSRRLQLSPAERELAEKLEQALAQTKIGRLGLARAMAEVEGDTRPQRAKTIKAYIAKWVRHHHAISPKMAETIGLAFESRGFGEFGRAHFAQARSQKSWAEEMQEIALAAIRETYQRQVRELRKEMAEVREEAEEARKQQERQHRRVLAEIRKLREAS